MCQEWNIKLRQKWKQKMGITGPAVCFVSPSVLEKYSDTLLSLLKSVEIPKLECFCQSAISKTEKIRLVS